MEAGNLPQAGKARPLVHQLDELSLRDLADSLGVAVVEPKHCTVCTLGALNELSIPVVDLFPAVVPCVQTGLVRTGREEGLELAVFRAVHALELLQERPFEGREDEPPLPGASRATGPAEPVDVLLSVVRQPNLNDVRDVGVVDASGRDVGGKQHRALAVAELFAGPVAVGLALPTVNFNDGDIHTLVEQIGIKGRQLRRGEEDDDLVVDRFAPHGLEHDLHDTNEEPVHRWEDDVTLLHVNIGLGTLVVDAIDRDEVAFHGLSHHCLEILGHGG